MLCQLLLIFLHKNVIISAIETKIRYQHKQYGYFYSGCISGRVTEIATVSQ
jgi:hypothetical protein